MSNQLSLFDQPIALIDRDCLGIVGLIYVRSFIPTSEQSRILLEVDNLKWRHDLKRRVQHYSYKYDYKARRVDSSMYVGPLPRYAMEIGERLVKAGLLTAIPDQMIVNEYMPGQGITPHIDCEPCFADTIVTISLGSVYTMDFIDTATEDTKELTLEIGSALVLSHEARYRWKHGIKARKSDGERRRAPCITDFSQCYF